MNKIKLTILDILIIALSLVIFLFLVRQGVKTFPDTNSYLNNSLLRTPPYPLLLDFFKFLFGSDYLLMIVRFQIILSFLFVLVLSWTIKQYFNLGKLTFYIIYFILLSPIYSPFVYLSKQLQIANNILSESITYSLFLLTITVMVKFIFELKLQYLIYVLLCSVLTAMVRPQFLFLYFFDIIIIIYYGYITMNFVYTLVIGLLLSLFIFTASLLTKTYNFIYHGIFAGIPTVGVQLITPQLYLSHSQDIELFTNIEEKAWLAKIYEEMVTRQLLNPSDNSIPVTINKYYQVYNSIWHDTVFLTYANQYTSNQFTPQSFRDYTNQHGKDKVLTSQQFIDLDKITTSIALKLITINYLKFFKLYAHMIINQASYYISGGYVKNHRESNMIGIFYCSILVWQWCLFTYLFLKTRKNLFFAFLSITTLYFMNYGLVGMVEPVMLRYSFYTDTVQLAFQVIFVFYIIKYMKEWDPKR